jgi:NADH:ubiquinone oxidoreductase subunit 5 (subunit L)/multisubunit Na+/H+ antiporter MnhA subunit
VDLIAYPFAVFFGSLLIFAAIAFADSERRPRSANLALAVGSMMVVGALVLAVLLWSSGPQTLHLFGEDAPAPSLRLDAVSAILIGLIGFLGAIVLSYSRTYLDGEARQSAFLGWMSLTLCAVGALVAAGDLITLVFAWIATSLCLHRLLLFYPERPGAQRAARKKHLVARASDAALIGAAILLWAAFGEIDLAAIAERAAANGASSLALGAAVLIAVAALLKSAQFPAHGWLIEAMETPTPVSALLHAGLINAGGFLLIRFADVLVGAPGVMAALVMIGGFTALFGSLVMLTQSAVKTSLAWSTIAQMGFMVFQCGLALFPLALLHIVAHSLYKAHAFLSSGGAVARVASIRRPGPVAIPGLGAVARAFLAALAIYGAVAIGFGFAIGFDAKSPQAIALGAILIFGVAYLLAQGFADAAPRALTRLAAVYAGMTAFAYFALQTGAESLLAGTLPATPAPGPLEWALIALALISFGGVAVAQSTFPLWSSHPAAAGLRVHLVNGLYVNALSDRLLGGWASAPSSQLK